MKINYINSTRLFSQNDTFEGIPHSRVGGENCCMGITDSEANSAVLDIYETRTVAATNSR